MPHMADVVTRIIIEEKELFVYWIESTFGAFQAESLTGNITIC